MVCEFCLISQKKTEAETIYEDDKVMAVLHLKPAFPGQVIIFPKKHLPIIELVPDDLLTQMAGIANKISIALFESLKIEGTNIIIENGLPAGQIIPHFSINLIPRKENDGLNLSWSPKKLSEDEMEIIHLQLKEAADKISPEKIEKEKTRIEEKEEKKVKEESYLVKGLRRIP